MPNINEIAPVSVWDNILVQYFERKLRKERHLTSRVKKIRKIRS
jgi:hypothetical protein